VIETYKAFIIPLKPRSPDLGPGALEMDYDRTTSDRKSIAKSVVSCRGAIEAIKGDLEAWGKRCVANREHDGYGKGQSGNTGGEERRDGRARLAEEMGREVLLVAITPTKQRMASSVGREVSLKPFAQVTHSSERKENTALTRDDSPRLRGSDGAGIRTGSLRREFS
jgi:hypothetical protein